MRKAVILIVLMLASATLCDVRSHFMFFRPITLLPSVAPTALDTIPAIRSFIQKNPKCHIFFVYGDEILLNYYKGPFGLATGIVSCDDKKSVCHEFNVRRGAAKLYFDQGKEYYRNN